MGAEHDPQRQLRSEDWAQRSVGRYLSLVFEDFSIFLAPREPDGVRPSVFVRPVGERTRTGPFHSSDLGQSYAVYLYPEPGKNNRDAGNQAYALKEIIDRVFEFGFNDGLNDIGFSMRVPMWDWTDVSPGTPIPDDQDEIVDYFKVDGYTSQALVDPDDVRRWSIVSTLRLAWTRHPTIYSGIPVEAVGVQPQEDGIH